MSAYIIKEFFVQLGIEPIPLTNADKLSFCLKDNVWRLYSMASGHYFKTTTSRTGLKLGKQNRFANVEVEIRFATVPDKVRVGSKKYSVFFKQLRKGSGVWVDAEDLTFVDLALDRPRPVRPTAFKAIEVEE